METFFKIYVLGIAAAWAALLLWRAAGARRRTGRCTDGRSVRCARLTAAAMVGQCSVEEAVAAARRLPADELARVLVLLMDNLCGQSAARLGEVARGAGLYDKLVRRAARRRGLGRAYALALLARLPADNRAAHCAGRYVYDSNRYIRFYALMIQMSADSSTAIRRIGGLTRPLTHFEIAEMMTLLRQGNCPVACTPLLRSGNRNLAMLGIHIVRRYGMAECERTLHTLAACAGDPDLSTDAVRSIAALRGDASSGEVRSCLQRLSPAHRRSIYRNLALEGYSAAAIAPLFADSGDEHYFESVLNTYKRRIICQYA